MDKKRYRREEREVMNRERNVNLDILRIVACLLVVLSHVSSVQIDVMPVTTFDWNISHIYNTLGHTGTILFLFLSGLLLLSEEYDFQPRKFYRRNFLTLLVAYVAWILIYHLIGFVQRGNWGPEYIKDVIINVIKGEASYHFWYLPMLLGIYLILPMLRAICHAGRKLPVYFVILFLIHTVLFGTILYLDFPKKYLVQSVMTRIPFTLINHYVGYFVMGYVLYRLLRERKVPGGRWSGVGMVVLGVVGALVGDLAVTAQTGDNSVRFNQLFSLTLCMCAVGIFALVIQLTVRMGEKAARLLTAISKLTFGVYMIHPLVMSIFENLLGNNESYGVIGIPLVTLLVCGISLFIVWLASMIPPVKKWILFAGSKKGAGK